MDNINNKQDVIEDIFAKKNKRARLRKEGIIIGILAVLSVVVFLQSMELSRLRGYAQAAGQKAAAQAGQQQAPVQAKPNSNSGLPSQVGGC